MSISRWDDFPVHQTAEYIAHPATSDSNFYDRYYFNMHPCSDEMFAIFGLGQYPNLGVIDAFVGVTTKEDYKVIRASKPLIDRSDLQVGPIRVEIIKPLEELRVICEPNEFDFSMDVTWKSFMPAIEEQNQYLRQSGKVVFNTQRFTQMGFWKGKLKAGELMWEIDSDNWWGIRDRSWGIRPVGEPSPDGIRSDTHSLSGMWNHYPMQFPDHSLLYMLNEENDGTRKLEEGRRIWKDPSKPIEYLGRPEYKHTFHPGTRVIKSSVIDFPDAPTGPIKIRCKALIPNYLSLGTGYGLDQDWRHGLYQGPNEVVQAKSYKVKEIAPIAQYGVVDQVGKYQYKGHTGYGLFEHAFIGPFDNCGFKETDTAS